VISMDNSANLPDCDHREQTSTEHVYFCRQPRMHVAGGLVNATICRLCSVRNLPVPVPRAREEFVEEAHAAGAGHGYSGPPEVRQFPSLLQLGWNLTQSITAFVADGLQTVTKEQYEARLAICDTCDRRQGTRCQQCGCDLAVKAKGRAFQCPLGKWPSLM